IQDRGGQEYRRTAEQAFPGKGMLSESGGQEEHALYI
ncbi:MAG: hypothetical protein RI910_2962, partial [Verrucomicrobiota bacterium]